jgi:hypothetical protein
MRERSIKREGGREGERERERERERARVRARERERECASVQYYTCSTLHEYY